MLENIRAVAFDIDGTMYSSHKFYLRIIPYFIRHLRFFMHYNKVRKILHRTAPLADFYEYQARLLGEELGCNSEKAKVEIKKIVYDGMMPYFQKTKSFAGLYDCVKAMKDAGLKIAILSDFPPSQKGDIWGIKNLCDLVLGSEDIGALKPSKYPFGVMAQKLNLKCEEILYVGNSIKYDVQGSKKAGMKAAYILPWWKKILHLNHKEADVNFSSYRQLAEIVLK